MGKLQPELTVINVSTEQANSRNLKKTINKDTDARLFYAVSENLAFLKCWGQKYRYI